jgi:hypothetical protein
MVTRHGTKWAVVTGAAVALIALMWPIYKFGVVFGVWQPFTKPPGISSAAHYVSWIEDGTWFDCAVDLKRNVNTCKAWDSDGRLQADGDFRLECQGRAATNAELRPSSVSSSGGRGFAIYLFGKDGARSQTLVPVTNGRQNPCPKVTITYPSSSEVPRSPSERDGVPKK